MFAQLGVKTCIPPKPADAKQKQPLVTPNKLEGARGLASSGGYIGAAGGVKLEV